MYYTYVHMYSPSIEDVPFGTEISPRFHQPNSLFFIVTKRNDQGNRFEREHIIITLIDSRFSLSKFSTLQYFDYREETSNFPLISRKFYLDKHFAVIDYYFSTVVSKWIERNVVGFVGNTKLIVSNESVEC